jgi:hypothetical protein
MHGTNIKLNISFLIGNLSKHETPHSAVLSNFRLVFSFSSVEIFSLAQFS